jgi:predicted glycosyltransferase
MRPEAPAGHPRLFFYVQHLLGIGHLHRAARIAKALAAEDFDVRLALGGVPTPDLDVGRATVVQLPPVKAGPEGFAALVGADGAVFDAEAAARRTALLLEAFDGFAPDVLAIEAFPFGRSQMRFELLPLLDRARDRSRPPLVVGSVRDILQRGRRPDRVAETVELVHRFFDLVLVHGDPGLVSLESSFPEAGAFAAKLAYTGLVAPGPVPARDGGARYGAVVSAGGGAVGGPLLEAALRARPLTSLAARPWLVLTGPNLPAPVQALLATQANGAVQVERFVPDLAQVLSQAEVSISQAGYNTVADILAAGCRSVLIPYGRDGETEQGDRAALLQARGAAVVVGEDELTPQELAAAIDRALAQPAVPQNIDLDGARGTGRVLRRALAERSDGERHRRP